MAAHLDHVEEALKAIAPPEAGTGLEAER
jgi:hypothetical protein